MTMQILANCLLGKRLIATAYRRADASCADKNMDKIRESKITTSDPLASSYFTMAMQHPAGGAELSC